MATREYDLASAIRRASLEENIDDPRGLEKVFLDGLVIRSTGPLGFLSEYCIACCSMKGCKLKEISESFPDGCRIERLDLQNNNLTDLSHLSSLPCLGQLHLDNNEISDISQLEHLKGLVDLSILSLEGNPLTELQGYSRDYVFNLIQSLEILDSCDREGTPVVLEDDEECSVASCSDSLGGDHADVNSEEDEEEEEYEVPDDKNSSSPIGKLGREISEDDVSEVEAERDSGSGEEEEESDDGECEGEGDDEYVVKRRKR